MLQPHAATSGDVSLCLYDGTTNRGRFGAVTGGGEVHDDGHVLVTTPHVPSEVLTNADYMDTADKYPMALGEDRFVRGVPHYREALSDLRQSRRLVRFWHDPLERQRHSTVGELGLPPGGLAGVVAPHVPAPRCTGAAGP